MVFNPGFVKCLGMNEIDFPSEIQLLSLYRFLMLLKNGNIYWHAIEPRGDRILIKAEPPEGEIEIRIFYIETNGEVNDDGFREQLP